MSDYPKWEATPACVGTDNEEWFPVDDTSIYNNPNTLRRICSGCEVFNQCYEYAITHAVHGWWANTTPRVRQHIRRHLGIEVIPIHIDRDRL